jgi:hypothetical protein
VTDFTANCRTAVSGQCTSRLHGQVDFAGPLRNLYAAIKHRTVVDTEVHLSRRLAE